MKKDNRFTVLLAQRGIALKLKSLPNVLAYIPPESRLPNDAFIQGGVHQLFPDEVREEEQKEKQDKPAMLLPLSSLLSNLSTALHKRFTSPASNTRKDEKLTEKHITESSLQNNNAFTIERIKNIFSEKQTTERSHYKSEQSKNSISEKHFLFLQKSFRETIDSNSPGWMKPPNALNSNAAKYSGKAIQTLFTRDTTDTKLISPKIGAQITSNYLSDFKLPAQKRELLSGSNYLSVKTDSNNKDFKSNYYSITQNFGDIVIQPASMDMSMQQVKYKIEDVLKQVKDSLY